MLLDSYRVLDLADHRGQLCGKILAGLGADVVKVEPPGGDRARRIGPFLDDDPHPEKSLYWLAHNTSKRSITLDITKEDGKRLLVKMAEKAEFLIESFLPGYMEALGLSYENLSRVNASLIAVSITPFGRTGPYSGYRDSDLINMGMGGLMALCGDPDRAPLRFAAEQSYPLAGMHGAVAALAAHLYRERTGRGQHIDVSIQESVLLATLNLHQYWELQQLLVRREGSRNVRGEVSFRNFWRCRDGYVSWRLFTAIGGKWTRALVEWMEEEGKAGFLAEVLWEEIDMGGLSQEEIDRLEAPFEAFFLEHTRGELFHEALKREFLVFPMNTTGDLLDNEQLRARGFWWEVEYPGLGAKIKHPGPPFQCSRGEFGIKRAPGIGEHNREIYAEELGLSDEELLRLKEAGVI